MSDRPLQILLIEDNPADVRLAREAFREGKLHEVMHVAKDGAEAMSFLRREGSHADAQRPDLIFLDLNLPRKDGREVLAELKKDPELRRIPVVILTTSTADTDINACYDLHANCYIVKPGDLDRYFEAIRGAENFWLKIVKRSPT